MQVKQRLDALTSLRFFAAAMIVIGHGHRLFGSFELANNFSLTQGVSFFFVLSGFILAYNYPLLKTKADILHFFQARFSRIWPAHVFAIALLYWLTTSLNISGLPSESAVIFSTVANFFLFQSIVPLRDVFLAFNGVAWSISTELFFYFAFPFLIPGRIFGLKLKFFCLFTLLFLYVWFGAGWSIPTDEALPGITLMGLLYVNPVVRVFEFFLGILACYLLSKQEILSRAQRIPVWLFTLAEVVVVSLAIVSMWLTPRLIDFLGIGGEFWNVCSYYLTKAGSAPVFAVLIIILALGRGGLSRLISAPVLVLLGEVSFALYLVHMVILKWYELNLVHFESLPRPLVAILYWALSIFVAWLVYKSIEKPCRVVLLKIPKISFREALKILLSGRQVIYSFLMIVTLCLLKYLPVAIPYNQCGNECDVIINSSALSVPGKFGNYAELLAVQTSPESTKEGRLVELVFAKNNISIPDARLAVHVVSADGKILHQIDYALVKNRSLESGQMWLERVLIPDRFISADAVGIGLAIYSDPREPFEVSFLKTDFGGRRLLLGFNEIIVRP